MSDVGISHHCYDNSAFVRHVSVFVVSTVIELCYRVMHCVSVPCMHLRAHPHSAADGSPPAGWDSDPAVELH
jgi:hypothetical protein